MDVIGRVTTFDDLRAIIDAYRKSLGITLLELDDKSGVQHGYSSKLACGIKNYGNISLPCIMGALGLELIIVRAASGHKQDGVNSKTYIENYKRVRKKVARLGAIAANNKKTAEERRKAARKAATARWAKYRQAQKKMRKAAERKAQGSLF